MTQTVLYQFPVSHFCEKALWALDYKGIAHATHDMIPLFHVPTMLLKTRQRLAEEIQPSGYLAGDQFSIADLTAAALISPLVQPDQAPYPLPENPPAPFMALCEELSVGPVLSWVQNLYKQHRHKH